MFCRKMFHIASPLQHRNKHKSFLAHDIFTVTTILPQELFRTSVHLCEYVVHQTLNHLILFSFYIVCKSYTLPTLCGTEV